MDENWGEKEENTKKLAKDNIGKNLKKGNIKLTKI